MVGAATGAVLLATCLPWVRTGNRRRTSYALLGLVDRLDFAPGGPAEWAVRWWPVMPMLCVVAMTAAWWPRQRLAGTTGLAVAAYAGGVSVALRGAPVTVLWGARMVLPLAAILAVASIACLLLSGGRPTRPAGSAPA